jgi:hypothetical protein
VYIFTSFERIKDKRSTFVCLLTWIIWIVRADADAGAADIILDQAFLKSTVNCTLSDRAPTVIVSDRAPHYLLYKYLRCVGYQDTYRLPYMRSLECLIPGVAFLLQVSYESRRLTETSNKKNTLDSVISPMSQQMISGDSTVGS